MADDQIIYLSPEDDLTNVRERLQGMQARRITFVVPQDTQLRSHVSWRVLHSRARELSKEVLIISSDRQIRSVAKAAGFKVADSQESPANSRTRPASRTGSGGKSAPNDRTSTGKVQSSQQRTGRSAPSSQLKPAGEGLLQSPEENVRVPRQNDMIAGGAGRSVTPSSTFEDSDIQFGTDYEFRVEPHAARQSSLPPEDEFDPLIEDYYRSQSIREAAKLKRDEAADKLPGPPKDGKSTQAYSVPAGAKELEEDPFAYLDEDESVSLLEQHGQVSFEGLDENGPDISEHPTNNIVDSQIEFLGDQGDIVESPFPPSLPNSPRPGWSTPAPEEEIQPPESVRVHGFRSRSSRLGKVPMQPAPRQPNPRYEIEEEDTLPVVSERPASAQPLPRQTGKLSTATGKNPVTPVAPVPPRREPINAISSPKGRASVSNTSKKNLSRSSKQPVTRRRTGNNRGILITMAIIILFILLTGILSYLVPSADVTLTVNSQSFNVSLIQLNARPDSKLDVAHQSVASDQLLSKSLSVSAQGTTTGTKRVGTVAATGNVVFTYTSPVGGPSSIDIPTGTIVTTSTGVQFVTQADALIQSVAVVNANKLPNPPVPVQANSPGENGNVSAGSIIVIPGDSLKKIALKGGVDTSVLNNLTVNNPNPTNGGGVGTIMIVAKDDISKLKVTLDQQIQSQVTNWLNSQLQQGDVAGKTFIDETVTATPAEGQEAPNGTFSESIQYQANVLIVRKAALQEAANAQFNSILSKQHAGYTLAPGQDVTWPQLTSVLSSDGKSFTLTFSATGQITPLIAVQDVRNLIKGQQPGQVASTLVGTNGLPGVKSVAVKVNPTFFPWVPFWAERINVHFKVLPVNTLPSK